MTKRIIPGFLILVLSVGLFFPVCFPAHAALSTPAEASFDAGGGEMEISGEDASLESDEIELVNDLVSSADSGEDLAAIREAVDTCRNLLFFSFVVLALIFGCFLAFILSQFLR